MRRFTWTRILSVLLALCMVTSFVSMGIPAALAERVTLDVQTHTDLTWEQVMSGTYYSDEACTTQVSVQTETSGTPTYGSAKTVSYNRNSFYTTYENNGYYYKNGDSYELITDIDCTRSGYSWPGYSYSWTITTDQGKRTSTESTISVYQRTSESTTTYTLVANGTTYTGTDATAQVGVTLYSKDTLEYFPVTLYDYDAGKMNALTHKADIAAGLGSTWNGLYFSNGDPQPASYREDTVNITFSGDYAVLEDGSYIIYSSGNGCYMTGNTTSSSPWGTTAILGTRTEDDAGTFTITSAGDNKYTVKNSNGRYLDITGDNAATFKTSVNYVYFMKDGSNLVIQDQDGWHLNALGGTNPNYNHFGGWTGGSPITLYKATGSATATLPFANHNHWAKGQAKNNQYGQMIYSGLVQPQLDANKDIVFNVPDAGLFTDAAFDGKKVYTGVQLPFVYNNSTKYYTFDSAIHGVYWKNDDGQKTSETIQSNSKLFWDKDDPQGWSGMNYGDGSKNLWAPFNNGDAGDEITGDGVVQYFFGMNATIPFTMTANGRLNASSDDSDPIEFSFSGDDDVWIFVDGKLVADLGGIHNRLDVTINFATNKVTYFVSEDNTAKLENQTLAPIGDGNTTANMFSSFTTEKNIEGSNGLDGYSTNLFNDGDTTGLLGTDLATFAATDNHELTIFYMERGGGSSNSRIKFNLPVKDTLTVQKLVDKKIDLNASKTGLDTDAVTDLTDAEQAVVDNLNFGFTLYKRQFDENGDPMVGEDGNPVFKPVANKTYNLLNANGQVVANPSTDANGKFYLKNGQKAKFTSEFNNETDVGDLYYVVEDAKNGFIYTTYNAVATEKGVRKEFGSTECSYFNIATDENGSPLNAVTNMNATAQSATYQVIGGADSEDSLSIVCENYMNASLPTPSAIPNDDKFVLDYGLKAELEIFSNDLVIGNDPTISIDTSKLQFGTAAYDPTTKKVTYTPTAQMTAVEVIPYTLTVSAKDDAQNTYTDEGTAYIYIIPATSVYYEENFGFVDFKTQTGTGVVWEDKINSDDTNEYQEPGKVGTVGDSPYGSDAAYLTDSGDSNGSSKYVNTTNGAAQFVYSFTGTGTSFYVRTTNNSAYLRIRIYDVAKDEVVYASYLDTVYKTDDNTFTLYNIPVFTWNAVDFGLDYGEYKVEVTVAKKTTTKDGSTVLYHSDFWLDGIRVFEPLNPGDANYAIAESAYATDEESNMTVVTLRDKLISTMTYIEETRVVQELKVDENGDPVKKYDEEGKFIGYVMVEREEIVNVPVWPTDGTFVLFTDTLGEIKTAEDYVSKGPKEEVYLAADQTVSFSLVDWDPNTYDIYLGIKAPTGSGKVEIGSTQLTISNAADCYYNISKYGTITTEKITEYVTVGEEVTTTTRDATVVTFDITSIEGRISLTNIKVTGDVQFIIIPNTDVTVDGSTANG